MVRVMLKGGVWKNSEDEVLKAAVMKYGLNNWSRVASLLVRKSAKQCKARWYEWLDPSVNKTEWTREEDEKLLHLAKLFPTQWRTIAKMVGRTAFQCLERYERLLDQAQGKTEMDENDPRRVRPGEIDPHPETKPSRADAVDMDDDEKEMLSEARARLANTRGKKAKRKAREKQMEEARRLATLQKKRELKAAGIQLGQWKPKKPGVDYGKDIPFEHQPPAGFHEVGADERPEGNLSFANISLQHLEGKRRDDEDARHRKDDERKLKRLKQDNLPQAIDMIAKLNDPNYHVKRSKLSLPSPSLQDHELEEIVRLGGSAASVGGGSVSGGHARTLVDDAASAAGGGLSGLTPMRTPKQDNLIMIEAQNAVARMSAQTPLEGGENPEIIESGLGASRTVIPSRPGAMKTPNPLAMQQGRQGAGGATPAPSAIGLPSYAGGARSMSGATPMTRRGGGMFRDDVQSIHPQSEMGTENPEADEAMLRLQVRTSLANLPKPQNEIEIAPPEVDENGDTTMGGVGGEIEEDAEDIAKRKEEEEKARLEMERRKRSKVVQAGGVLPRLLFVNTLVLTPTEGDKTGKGAEELQAAEAEVLDEMKKLIFRDAIEFPPTRDAPRPPETPEVEDISLEALERAAAELDAETEFLQQQMQHVDVAEEKVMKAWQESLDAFAYAPSQKRFIPAHQLPRGDRVETVRRQLDELRDQLLRDSERRTKLEQRLGVKTHGYMKRSRTALKSTEEHFKALQDEEMKYFSYAYLHEIERMAVQRRLDEERVRAEKTSDSHAQLQALFARLKNDKRDLLDALQHANAIEDEEGGVQVVRVNGHGDHQMNGVSSVDSD